VNEELQSRETDLGREGPGSRVKQHRPMVKVSKTVLVQ